MNVEFTEGQQPFVQQAIESGRIRRPEDAAREAFNLWVEHEKAISAANFGRRVFDKAEAEAAAARILKSRETRSLPEGLTIRELIDTGRD